MSFRTLDKLYIASLLFMFNNNTGNYLQQVKTQGQRAAVKFDTSFLLVGSSSDTVSHSQSPLKLFTPVSLCNA